jgi:Mrp family chromosome partitioning ATPase
MGMKMPFSVPSAFQRLCAKGYFQNRSIAELNRSEGISMRILLYTGKGGVGKTSISAASAVRCAELGYHTAVLSTTRRTAWATVLIGASAAT